jgi:hypothetical protein
MKATEPIADTATRTLIRQATLERPQVLAFPILGPPRDLGHVFTVEVALARGDTVAARAELRRFTKPDRESGETIPADAVLLESRLWLMLADTAAAVKVLDHFLVGMPSTGTNLLPLVDHAAGLNRLQKLRETVRGD